MAADAHYSVAVRLAAYHVLAVAEDDISYARCFKDGSEVRFLANRRRAKDILTRACLTTDQSAWLRLVAHT